jgi:hypothetical protein
LTTNFSLFTNIEQNPGWHIFFFPQRPAEHKLSIDKDLTKFLSEKLGKAAFDYFQYSVVDQLILRSIDKGNLRDRLYISGEWLV